MKNMVRLAAYGVASLVMVSAGYVLGQQSAPTDYKLVTEDVLATIDLANEIDGVQDRALRLSRATIAPGGHVGLHSHQGDPSIVYMLSGVLANHHDDASVQEVHVGEAFAEFGPRSHWIENRGSVPASFIVANIHRRK
jgi:quercetin dioxygenase-like cupin family protein